MTTATPQPLPLSAPVMCARRELAMRRSAYPRWVQTGKMRQAAADHELAAMEQILKTLEDPDFKGGFPVDIATIPDKQQQPELI